MRDFDRWKDKIELQLDGRQIFFLFFGSALCACLIFVLGVVVGKRVEARAHAQAPVNDPLAALDELGNIEEGLTFHNTLTDKKDGRRPGRTGHAEGAAASEERSARADSPAAAAAEPRAALAQGAAAREAERKPAAGLGAVKPPAADGKPQGAPPKEAAVAGKDPSKDPKDDGKGKNHFTLQLSAFATKSEATDFIRRLRDAGHKPFMLESMVPGKGLMYRVRLGDFTSRDSAISAKGDFERKHKMVAYVAKL